MQESHEAFVFMNENKQSFNSGPWWKPGIQILSEISTWIVIPIILALIAGKALDNHYGTKPVIFLCLAGLGFLVTCLGIFRVMKNYMKKINPDVKSGPRPESVGEDKNK